MSEPTRITLDVRPTLAAGGEPFGIIMENINKLTNPGDELVLIAPFEPKPLYKVLERQGFTNETTSEDGTFTVRFTRR